MNVLKFSRTEIEFQNSTEKPRNNFESLSTPIHIMFYESNSGIVQYDSSNLFAFIEY